MSRYEVIEKSKNLIDFEFWNWFSIKHKKCDFICNIRFFIKFESISLATFYVLYVVIKSAFHPNLLRLLDEVDKDND